jgi:hypothetical protein
MSEPSTKQTPSRTRAAETDRLIKFLRTIQDERTIPYSEIREVGGFGTKDKEERVRGLLRSAVWAILREDARVFAVVNGIGIKLANVIEVMEIGEDVIHRARRMTKRAIRKMATVNPEELPKEKLPLYCATSAQLAALSQLGERKTRNRIQQHTTQFQQNLSVAETLKLAQTIQ